MNHSRVVAVLLSVTFAVNAFVPLSAAQPKTPATLELFGTKLQGASRTQLQEVFKKSGLRAVRVDDHYWVDTYHADGVLEGASDFSAGYVAKTNQFAFAKYKFEGFMQVDLVKKVAQMVRTKYGPPTSRSGDPALGQVKYKWDFPRGMYIEVSRDWPDTTTYLSYVDKVAYIQMRAEQAAEKQVQEKAKAKAQSSAF
jgi:hypothetical protein